MAATFVFFIVLNLISKLIEIFEPNFQEGSRILKFSCLPSIKCKYCIVSKWKQIWYFHQLRVIAMILGPKFQSCITAMFIHVLTVQRRGAY